MKRSISFGLNCVDAAAYNNWPGHLNGCWNDADKTSALLATAGYEARAYFDAECTRQKLRNEFVNAAALLEPGDTFVFSNSGHGSQSLGVWFATEEGMCLYDGILGDSEFRQLIAGFKAGVNVVAILDICHAGGLSKALGVTSRVAPLWVTKNMLVTPREIADVSANSILMAACLRDELSGDGAENGAYTGSYLETIQEGMSWRQWMTATQRYMSQKFSSQHPELISIGGAGLEDAVV